MVIEPISFGAIALATLSDMVAVPLPLTTETAAVPPVTVRVTSE